MVVAIINKRNVDARNVFRAKVTERMFDLRHLLQLDGYFLHTLLVLVETLRYDLCAGLIIDKSYGFSGCGDHVKFGALLGSG